MREIKFRLFGKNSKEFLSPENVGLNLKELQNVCDIDLWHVMQFTGLIDKNGAEIYEGDIIEFSSSWDQHVCTVSFNKCKFGFGKEIKGDLGINDDCDLVSFTHGSGCKGYAVIGNIHQNPELLEGDK